MFLARVFGVVLNVSYLRPRKRCLRVGTTVSVGHNVVYDSERHKCRIPIMSYTGPYVGCGSSVSIVTRLRDEWPNNRSFIPGMSKTFVIYWSPPGWLSGSNPAFLWMVSRLPFPRGRTAGTSSRNSHFHLAPSLGKCGTIRPLPHMPLWRVPGQLCRIVIYIFIKVKCY